MMARALLDFFFVILPYLCLFLLFEVVLMLSLYWWLMYELLMSCSCLGGLRTPARNSELCPLKVSDALSGFRRLLFMAFFDMSDDRFLGGPLASLELLSICIAVMLMS